MIKVIPRAIQIGGHQRNGVELVLAPVGLWHMLMPAILAIAYHSLVMGSSDPVRR